MYIWKTIKIFVSSTFRDLEKERDELSVAFRNLQQKVFSRNLHITPYDLRWQDQNDPNLVRWCLDKVEKCEYFVGIIGNRYGWQPPYDYFGDENIQSISITEMEIRKALECTDKKKRFFCFLQHEETPSPQIVQLKELLKDEKIIHVQQQDISSCVYNTFSQMLDDTYPIQKQTTRDNYMEIVREMIEEKSRGFTGRKELLSKLHNFLQTKNGQKNTIVIEGVAGCGKSAIVSQFLCEISQKKIAHYVGTFENQSLYHLHRSLGAQLLQLGFIEKLQQLPQQLSKQIQNTLQNIEEPLVVVIDGVDEFANRRDFFQWWPTNISKNVRVIWTARLGENYSCQVHPIVVPALEEQDMRTIIDHQRSKVRISSEQEDLLLQYSQGNPLYLKVALEEISLGGIAVGQLAKNIDALFQQVMQRLQTKYNQDMVCDYLGLIAASSLGMTEMELRECLSTKYASDEYQAFCIEASESFASFFSPRKDIYQFFHQEFERSVKMMLGRGRMRDYHSTLAQFFWDKGFDYDRSLMELPFQLQWGERYSESLQILTDIDFLCAKCQRGMVVDLLNDLKFAAETTIMPIPEDLKIHVGEAHVSRNTLRLIRNALEVDLSFLIKHPQELFTCLWNQIFWHDSPLAQQYYPQQTNVVNNNMHQLVEFWRQSKVRNSLWLRSLRPLPHRLDSPLRRILRGHQDPIRTMALSPNTMYLASGDQKGKICIWELATGKLLQGIEAHARDISHLVFSEDSLKIISGSFDETVKVFAVESGECIHTLCGHQGAVMGVAHSQRYIFSAAMDQTLRVWDLENGTLISHMMSENELSGIAVYDNTHVIVTGEKSIEMWNIDKLQCVDSVTQNAEISCLHIHDNAIFTASQDKKIYKWLVEKSGKINPSPAFILERHRDIISDLHVEDNTLISSSFDKTIAISQLDSNTQKQLDAHENWVSAICRDGQTIYTCSWDSSIRVWSLDNIENPLYTLQGHTNDIESYLLSSDGKHIVTVGKDHKVNIWNEQGVLLQSIPRQKGHLDSIAITPDTTKLVSAGGSEGTTIEIWDTATGQCVQNLDSKSSRIMHVAANRDATIIAAGHMNGSIWLWKDNTEMRIEAHRGFVSTLGFSKDDTRIVSSGSDNFLRFWNVTTQELQCEISLEDKVETVTIHDSYVSCKIQGNNNHWDFEGNPYSETHVESKHSIDNSGDYTTLKISDQKTAFPIRLKEPKIVANRLYGYHNNHLFILQIG
ncbi:DUF4062 domain-containing protein [Candidatus Uabimicrobium amorphum]|uniref:DUF4062 domain-containing protein n=1 Tax=Uabimicrobium amorphum TaxID=2596890 RepID=A0A5S9ILF6_UABAM|nr:DUF4062 domain-containing protein [Candidatus Uabimicrobium amorphum]BBM83687.1 hypothetical protein UABAM_02040 [Candidatus Uabimicrobium amorphum]